MQDNIIHESEVELEIDDASDITVEQLDTGCKSKSYRWMSQRDVVKAFCNVDRSQEDKMVKGFLELGSQDVYNQLYAMREPTLKYWANKYAWLTRGDSEDMLSDLSIVWLNTIKKYRYEEKWVPIRTKEGHNVLDENGKIKMTFRRTPFNTYLYTSLRNYIINRLKHRYSNKRVDSEGVPYETTMKSLDYNYNQDETDDGGSMHDLIGEENLSVSFQHQQKDSSELGAEWLLECIYEMSDKDPEILEVAKRYAYDPRFKKIHTACKVIKDSLQCESSKEIRILKRKSEKSINYLTEMITKSGKYEPGFRIIGYEVYERSKRVAFEIVTEADTVKLKKMMHALDKTRSRIKMDAIQ